MPGYGYEHVCMAELGERRRCWTEKAKDLRDPNVDSTIIWVLMLLRKTGTLRERGKNEEMTLMNEQVSLGRHKSL